MLFNHRCFDLYNAGEGDLESLPKMLSLLTEVNQRFFGRRGNIEIIPVLDRNAPKPINNGISGIVLAKAGHFTCHTFSQRDVAFVDYFSARDDLITDEAASEIEALLSELYPSARIVPCTENLGAGFGRQVMIESKMSLCPKRACAMIQVIMREIGMHELSASKMVFGEGYYDIIQPITESHISIHQIEDNTLYIDVFSCRDFSMESLVGVLDQYLPGYGYRSITRGFELADKTL